MSLENELREAADIAAKAKQAKTILLWAFGIGLFLGAALGLLFIL